MKQSIEKQELGCGCGFLWGQFIDANIDELVNYCPTCGERVSKVEYRRDRDER